MIILSVISIIGFLCALVIHLGAVAKFAWVGDNLDSFLGFLFISGAGLLLITIIKAWDWSWGGFLENLTDDMTSLIKNLLLIVTLYPILILAIYHRRGGYSVALSSTQTIWEMSAMLLPLFLIPACYFWKERPT